MVDRDQQRGLPPEVRSVRRQVDLGPRHVGAHLDFCHWGEAEIPLLRLDQLGQVYVHGEVVPVAQPDPLFVNDPLQGFALAVEPDQVFDFVGIAR